MRVLLAALLFVLPACATLGTANPEATVRHFLGKLPKVEGQEQKYASCSAVVIHPGVALTAKHCLVDGEITVGGLAVTATDPEPTRDIAVLAVPGLQCPCATIGSKPAVGDPVLKIGFPGKAGRYGKQHISDEVAISVIGSVQDVVPWVPEGELPGTFIFTEKNILAPGDSGGGLFALQYGTWRLVGINSFMLAANPFMPVPVTSGFVPIHP